MTDGPRVAFDAEQLRALAGLLGWVATAYASSARDVMIVREWASGATDIPVPAQERLALAELVTEIVASNEGRTTARTWFVGLNPALDDTSPAAMIRAGRPEAVAPLLIGCARSVSR